MTSRRLAAGLIGAAAIVGVGLWLVTDNDSGAPSAPAGAPSQGASADATVAPSAPADAAPTIAQRHRYRLRLRATTTSELPADIQGDGALDVDAIIAVTELGDAPERVELAIEQVSAGTVSVLGQVVSDALRPGALVLVEYAPDGSVAASRTPDGQPAPTTAVLRSVVGELGPLRRGGSRWAASTMFGDGAVSETVAADGALERTRTAYDTLRFAPRASADAVRVEGAWTARLGVDKRIDTLTGGERVDVSRAGRPVAQARSQLSLKRLDTVDVALDDAARAAVAAAFARPEPVAPAPSGQRAALDQRIGDMTAARLRDDLLKFGAAGTMRDHGTWLWQVTGLLERDPSLAADLAALMDRPELGERGRALVLDVLANVGHGPAQAALRELLARPSIVADARYGEYLQRLALVQRPAQETLTFVAERFATDRTHADPLAYALGALAGAAREQGDLAAAEAAAAPIAAGLEGADLVTTRGLIDALGNAGVSSQVATVQAHASHADAFVRSAAAGALRKTPSPSATQTLLTLATDPSPMVQRAAIRSLTAHRPSAAQVASLMALVTQGALAKDAYGAVVTFASNTTAPPDALAALLDAVAAAQQAPARVRALATRVRRRIAL